MHLRIIIITFLVISLAACNTKPKASEEESVDVAQLLTILDQNVDQEVSIMGTVNHVCTHSGRRCFLIDSTGEYSIRIEAGGQIESFSQELIGSEIRVKGIVKEDRLSAEEINQMESDVLQKHPEDAQNTGENCSAEMANVNKMREWMKDHSKDYYALYYIDGISYESVE
ncbi:MAG: hypothetical protein ACERKD_02385 [Prolixibacteraceae bacterium]